MLGIGYQPDQVRILPLLSLNKEMDPGYLIPGIAYNIIGGDRGEQSGTLGNL